MRSITCFLLLLACSLLVGCETRVPKPVGALTAPGGRHVIRVMNESGGLLSGVVSVHLTKPGEQLTPQNTVLRTPDCTGTSVGWLDAETALIVYDSLYASSFYSGVKGEKLRVLMLDNRTAKDARFGLGESILLPCDPL